MTSKFEDIEILFNETEIIKCNGAGSPWPAFNWKLNGLEISRKQKIELNSSLESGVLSCNVKNMFGEDSASFKFNVIKIPFLTTNASETEVILKRFDDMTLECPIENCDKIIWDQNENYINKKLIYQKVDNPDAKKYICECSNVLGSAYHQFDVKVYYQPTADIDFSSSTKFSTRTLNFSKNVTYIKPHTKLTMKCETSGFPEPKISWFKNEEKLISENSEITIEMVTFNVDGKYECRAENSEGSKSSFRQIAVAETPKIANFTQIIDGKSHFISCFAHGYPIPKLLLEEQESQDIFSENSTGVEITKHEHDGIEIRLSLNADDDKEFKCIAENDYGGAEKSLHVERIETEPFLQFKYEDERDKHFEVFKSENLSLNCEFEGEPKPSIHWFDFDKHAYLDEQPQILTLNNVISPRYIVCSVKNSDLSIRRDFHIRTKEIWSEFSGFGPCSSTCGRGYRKRSRKCIASLNLCKDKNEIFEYEYCYNRRC